MSFDSFIFVDTFGLTTAIFNYRLDPTGRGKGECELLSVPLSHLDIGRDVYPDSDYDYYERDRNAASVNCKQIPSGGYGTGGGSGSYYGGGYSYGYGGGGGYADRRVDYGGMKQIKFDKMEKLILSECLKFTDISF